MSLLLLFPAALPEADLSAAGVATVSFVGGATAGTPLSAAGVAASALTSAAIFNALLEAAGVASVQGVGAALALAEWNTAGVSVVAWDGEDAGAPPSGAAVIQVLPEWIRRQRLLGIRHGR